MSKLVSETHTESITLDINGNEATITGKVTIAEDGTFKIVAPLTTKHVTTKNSKELAAVLKRYVQDIIDPLIVIGCDRREEILLALPEKGDPNQMKIGASAGGDDE